MTTLRKRLSNLPRLRHWQVAANLEEVAYKVAFVEAIEGQSPARANCPHCASAYLYSNGTADDLQRFQFRRCYRTFNAQLGTLLARLHMPRKWLG